MQTVSKVDNLYDMSSLIWKQNQFNSLSSAELLRVCQKCIEISVVVVVVSGLHIYDVERMCVPNDPLF